MTSFALESPKSNTLLIIVLSSSSSTPSSWLTLTMVFSSASVISGAFSFGLHPRRRIKPPVTTFSTATTGRNTSTQKEIIFTTARATFSAFCAAIVLGVISPKIRMITVITMVGNPRSAGIAAEDLNCQCGCQGRRAVVY